MDFYTTPFDHQLEDFELTKDRLTWAYFWGPGLGKTWEVINVARYQHQKGNIDALLVTAPSGVHANWLTDELPAHLPPDYPWEGIVWWPSVAHVHWHKGVKQTLREFVNAKDKLIVLATSYHAFLQDRSWMVIKQFLQERKVLWALDESDDIGNPDAKWTDRILRRSKLAVMRRICTGSPYKDGSPLPFWSQFNFLHEDIIGIHKFRAFKMKYAEWYVKPLPNKPYPALIPVKDPRTGRQKFKNLDELQAKILRRCSIRSKEDHLKFLPQKLWDKRYFELTQRQREVYERVVEENELVFADGFIRVIEMPMIVRLRLQQVACGFYPKDGDEPEYRIPGDQPRLETTVDEVLREPGQLIVWSRFSLDITDICRMLEGRCSVARYDGKVSSLEKQRAKEGFQAGDIKCLVANQAAMSRGFTLVSSHRAIYHSNYPRLLLREQSEDRQHRPGQHNAVLYTDIIAKDTVDWADIVALRSKMDTADFLMGRSKREWLYGG